MDPFVESEMTFGPYADGHCFRVEVSETYHAIQDKVQMAEFLLLRTHADAPPFVWIVEAKQSSPRPETQPNFNESIVADAMKMVKSEGGRVNFPSPFLHSPFTLHSSPERSLS